MNIIRFPVAGLCLLIPALAAVADAPDKTMQRGIDAYRAGQYQQAIQALQASIEQLQDVLNQRYLELLPDPPEGWQAGQAELAPPEVLAALGGGIHMNREYRRGAQELEIQLIADSPMLTALGAIIGNPDIIRSNPDTTPYRYQEFSGLRKKLPQGEEVSLLLGDTILIKLMGREIKDSQEFDGFLQAMDLDKIRQTLASP